MYEQAETFTCPYCGTVSDKYPKGICRNQACGFYPDAGVKKSSIIKVRRGFGDKEEVVTAEVWRTDFVSGIITGYVFNKSGKLMNMRFRAAHLVCWPNDIVEVIRL